MPTLDQLKTLYTNAKQTYYNDPQGKQLLSDDKFDLLEDKIKLADPKWKGFKAGSPINKKKKVKLPVPIFSLDKVKTAEGLSSWLDGSEEFVLMDKLDGSSLELIYTNGVPTRLITRGTGLVGGECSYLIPHLRGIPQKVGTKNFVVRCEGLFTKIGFQKYANEFDAARNAASGILNRSDVHKAIRDLSIVALQLLEPNLKMSAGLAWLKNSGFKVVANKSLSRSKISAEFLAKMLENRKSNGPYQMDGLVLMYDKRNALPRSGNPDWGIAWKKTIAPEDATITTVKQVHWKISAHGSLVPRIEVKPIRVGDATISFAAAFNAQYVVENCIGPGSKVGIIRSGDVIPYITKIVTRTKPQMPPESMGEWKWDKTHVNIVLSDAKSNPAYRLQKIARTFSVLKIDLLRGRTIEKLVDAGYDNVTKILRASVKDFMQAEGMQQKSAQNLWSAIHSKTDEGFPLTQLMNASGVFDRGVGETRLRLVAEHFNLIDLTRNTEEEITRKISGIRGFDYITARMIARGLPRYLKWSKVTGLRAKELKKIKPIASSLIGINISFTGFRNKDYEEQIVKNGGTVIAFGSKTTVLLVSAVGKSSDKVYRAKERGISVMTWEQFNKRYKLE